MGSATGIDPLYSLAGFVVGLLVGNTGVGGGSMMTPLLVLMFGIHPATAVGTDLLYAAATKSVGTVAHGIQGTVNWSITGRLAAGSVPATLLTLLAMSRFDVMGLGSARVLATGLGVALVLTSIALLSRRQILDFAMRRMAWIEGPRVGIATVALGALLGVLVTLSSVGAGAIGMTVLVTLYRRVPLRELVGSDIAHAVPLTLIAGLGHWLVGSVDWVLLSALLSGSIPGILLGTMLSARMPEWVLRPVLALTLLAVGMRLLV
jgi:hypothetical protein